MEEKLTALGYNGGKMIITHCLNEDAANALADKMRAKFKGADISIAKCVGLCSFYA